MKIALYIQDGLEQIVLTPETDTEKDILAKLHDGSREFELLRGSFFKCRGGWMRYGTPSRGTFEMKDNDDESTIIVMSPPKPVQAMQEADVFLGPTP